MMSGLSMARESCSPVIAARWIRCTVVTSLLMCGLAGCGGNDDSGGGTNVPPQSQEQQVEDGLSGLASVGTTSTQAPAAQLMANPALAGLLSGMGITLPDLGGLGGAPLLGDASYLPAPAAARLGSDALRTLVTRRTGIHPRALAALLDIPYGTYDRDRTDTSDPFPGWVLTEAGNPADGLIFRFPADPDDFVIVDHGASIPVGGEIRFLSVVIDDLGTPADPSDDQVTAMIYELALAIGDQTPALVARITYQIELDQQGAPTSIQIGSFTDLQNSFIGTLSFAFSMSAVDDDFDISLLLIDQSTDPDYGMLLSMSVLNYDSQTELPESVTFTFAYGGSSTPTSPPWAITTTLDSFRADPASPGDFIADVTGSIKLNDQTLATFTGDTTEVPVDADVNGDGQITPDDTCLNINISFAGPESENICVAFIDLASSFPQGGVGALLTGTPCPCAWQR